MSLLYSGNPLNGDGNDNFLLDYDSDGASATVNAGAGDDFVLGDIYNFWVASAAGSVVGAGSTLTSNLGTWNLDDNPDVGNATTVPHTLVYGAGTAGQTNWYKVVVGAGETITIDLDYGYDVIDGERDMEIQLFDTNGFTLLAANDDAPSNTTGGGGSSTFVDPYLSYTFASAGTYYIQVGAFQGGPGLTNFTGGEEYLLNISLTGQGHTGVAANGFDVIHGDNGSDTLYGMGGNDQIYGGADHDTMNGGADNDWLYGDSGLDKFTGGSGVDWFAFNNTALSSIETVFDYEATDYIYLANFSGPLTFNANGSGGLLQGAIQVNTSGNAMVVTQTGAGMLGAATLEIATLLGAGLSGINGAFVTHLFDLDNNEDFKVKDVYYDANGLLDFQKFFYDPGVALYQLYVDYDQTNAFAWSNFKNYYSAYGVIDFKWVYYDAGVSIWGAKTDYDQNGSFSWNYITYSYASAGVLDYVWTQYDAGQPLYASKTDYDQSSVFSWDSIVYAYASAGVLDYKWVYYDAGGSAPYAVKTDYDQANAFTWDQHIIVYDTPGHVFNEYYV